MGPPPLADVRAFLAIDLPSSSPPAETTPGTPAPPHLTLRFWAALDERREAALRELLGPRLARERPFPIRLEGVGAFPSSADPRIVWWGVTEGRDELAGLARRIDRALEEGAGERPDPRPFTPHLTLLRVRSRRDRARAEELLRGKGLPAPLPMTVDRVRLKQSQLSARGAIHTVLAEFPLEGAVGLGPAARGPASERRGVYDGSRPTKS